MLSTCNAVAVAAAATCCTSTLTTCQPPNANRLTLLTVAPAGWGYVGAALAVGAANLYGVVLTSGYILWAGLGDRVFGGGWREVFQVGCGRFGSRWVDATTGAATAEQIARISNKAERENCNICNAYCLGAALGTDPYLQDGPATSTSSQKKC